MASVKTARIQAVGDRVIGEFDGRVVFDCGWADALAIAEAIRTQAKQAEAHAMRDRIIADQAVLMRVGARVGLTGDRAMLREARQKAAWDRTLRRFLPGGVKSQSIVGSPSVRAEEGGA